jgi:hypothetical protein
MTYRPRPSRPTPGQLKRAGVTLTDPKSLTLCCDECGAMWSSDRQPDGRLPRGYWHCPNGCNTPNLKWAILIN